jgi:uncharacterized cupin superfamily protein
MAEVNLMAPEWDAQLSGPPFSSRVMRLGARAGAMELGASLYEIDPGGAVSPYHVHHGNEELLMVVTGTPQLRTPDGIRRLKPGDTVAFPRGPKGAHRVSNPGNEPTRVLIFSTMNFPEVSEHLDTGTTLAMTGPGAGRAFPGGGDQPFMELVLKAMHAAAEHERQSPPAQP